MAIKNSRMNEKNLEEARNAKFFQMFRKQGFCETLYILSLEDVSRRDFYARLKKEGHYFDYYCVELYLITHKLIKFSIDPQGSDLKVSLTKKGMLVREKIDAINQFLNEK